jgi:hypothetical protein
MSGNRTRVAHVTIEYCHCAIEAAYCCFSRRCMYDFVRTYIMGKSQLGGGGNPRTNKSVPQRMADCQSQLSFYIIKNTDARARAPLHAYGQRALTCLPGHQINIENRISALFVSH